LFSPRWQHNAFSLHPCRRLKAALHPLYDLVDAEALGPLAVETLERRKELGD